MLTYQVFSRDSSSIVSELTTVKESKARIIVVVCQASDGATLIHQGYSVGLGGPGYAWVGADGIMNSNLVNALDAKGITSDETKFLVQGVIGLTPGRDETSAEWSAYTTLWGSQPATLSAGGVCSSNTDASGNFIHRRGDVDNDATTPDACAGITTYDPRNPGSYAPYAYDIMMTYAYTADRWFKSVLNGGLEKTGSISDDPEGFFAEIIKTTFNGATGPVGFDANGDRVVGARYLVVASRTEPLSTSDLGFLELDSPTPLVLMLCGLIALLERLTPLRMLPLMTVSSERDGMPLTRCAGLAHLESTT